MDNRDFCQQFAHQTISRKKMTIAESYPSLITSIWDHTDRAPAWNRQPGLIQIAEAVIGPLQSFSNEL